MKEHNLYQAKKQLTSKNMKKKSIKKCLAEV